MGGRDQEDGIGNRQATTIHDRHPHVMVCRGCGFALRSNVPLASEEWAECPVCGEKTTQGTLA
jgi:rRNA maturation endonuclease Nob1